MGKHNVDELKKSISGITLTAIICLAMIVIGLNAQVVSVKANDVPPPTLKVVPSVSEAYPGETFDVNITINDLAAEWNLSGYEVNLHYGTDLLGVVDVITCEFFEDFAGPSGTFSVTRYDGDYYPPHSTETYDDVGIARAACVLLGDHTIPEGSGTLATITFQWDETEWSVMQLVCCDLVIEAKLVGSNGDSIPFTTIDGQFCPKEVPLLKVVASEVEVYPGETFDVNVTIDDLTAEWDLGGFELRIYFDTTVLNATDVVVGPFLQPFAGSSGTFNITRFGDDYYDWDFDSETSYDDVGCVLASSALLGDHATPHGSGTLATFTFVFEQAEGSALRLERYVMGGWWPLPAALLDSKQRVIPCKAIHGSVPEMPILAMVPSEASVSLGQAFNVDITISNLRVEWDLAGFDLRISYNTDVLDVINVVDGPFLGSFAGSGGTYFIAKFGDDWLPPHADMTYEKGGVASAVCVLLGEHTAPEGTGILATITFNATWMGESALEFEWVDTVTKQTWLYPAKLVGVVQEAKTIPCAAVSGHVSIGPAFPDLNDDGLVDIFDGVIMAIAYGTKPGDLKWNPRADVNHDNIIDIFDLMVWASHYGETTP